jgi:hypothetical protein
MHGPLEEIGLIEVLQLLERGMRSGVLRLSRGADPSAVDITVSGGVIVAVEPAAGDAAVGQRLVSGHLATEDDVRRHPALVDGALGLRTQLAVRAVSEVLRWTDGRFDFQAGASRTGPLSLTADQLALSAVHAETRRIDAAQATDEFRAIPRHAAAEIVAAGEPLDLSPLDWRVLDAIGADRDIEVLAAVLAEPVEDVAAAVQRLGAAAILELQMPAFESPPSPSAELPGDAIAARAWRALGLAEVAAGRFEPAIEAWEQWRRTAPADAGDAAALMHAAGIMLEAMREPRE